MIPGSVKGGISLILSVFGCTGNLFVILVVAAERRLHTMHYFVLASLALSHFLFHSFSIFVAVSQISEQWMFGIAWCKGNFYILKCLVFTTILLLCAVTWECHTAVVTPYEYSGDITVKKITVVVFLWIASFVFGAGPFFDWGRYIYNDNLYRCEQDFKTTNMISLFVNIVLFFIIPFGLITKQQYQLNRFEKLQKSQIAKQRHVVNYNSPEGQLQQKLMRNIKTSKDALIIVVAFVATYLPLCVSAILRKWMPESEELYNASFLAVTHLQVGATWNPFIYCFRKKRFRREFLQFLRIYTFKRISVSPQMT